MWSSYVNGLYKIVCQARLIGDFFNFEYDDSKNLFSKVSSTMLMEHFLCDDVGGKRNMCGMELKYFYYL